MVFATSHANAAIWLRQLPFSSNDPCHQKFMVTKPSVLSKYREDSLEKEQKVICDGFHRNQKRKDPVAYHSNNTL
jgi:hypothetical protein